jgi:hypothetical protein
LFQKDFPPQILTIATAQALIVESSQLALYSRKQLGIINASVSLSFGLGGRILITGTVV